MHKFLKDFSETNSNSDKITFHGYHRIYPWFLSHFKNNEVNLLEIGINETESLKLWKGYFDSVNLYGIDINKKEFDDPTVKIFQVDQSKADQLSGFVKDVEVSFDIILDDGSHVPEHQLLTLKHFWKILKPGGIYIIEDIETSYWGESCIYGYKFNANRTKLLHRLQNVVNFVNIEFLNKSKRNKLQEEELSDIFSDVEIISFAYNCIILIKKDVSSFFSFYRQDYKLSKWANYLTFFNRAKRKVKKTLLSKA